MQHERAQGPTALPLEDACGDRESRSAAQVEFGRVTCAPLAPEGVPAPLCRIEAELCYLADDCVARLGDRRDRLVYLQSGILRLVRGQADGRRHIATFLFPGDLVGFGERDATWQLDVEAVTPATLALLKPSLPDGRQDALYRWLFEVARAQARRAERHTAVLAMPSPIDRLAAFLLDLEGAHHRSATAQQETAVLTTGIDAIEIPMRRADIADYLALTIETVSRSFGRLVEAGAIRLPQPKRVLILDRLRLEQFAGQAPLRQADIA